VIGSCRQFLSEFLIEPQLHYSIHF
jgi:hypothetical protein